jgi:predicted NBD/HSP70 family sugar kinase
VKANHSTIIKTANRFLILNTIKDYEPVTVEDIVRKTHLSRPTVLTLLKELTEGRLISKCGFAESMGGRQPALFAIDTSSYYAIGIDMDYPPIRLMISNLKGEKVYSRKWELHYGVDIPQIVESIVHHIEESIRESGIDRQAIIGVGLGMPAIINATDNAAVRIERIEGWVNIPIHTAITDRTGLKVYVRNDAHLLAMVEKKLLNIKEANFLYVLYRSGIGMAIFINNALYEGNFGNSGYIGHTAIHANGERCECGKRGCLELYCSKRAIVKQYKAAVGSVHEGAGQELTFDSVIEKADHGDPHAMHVLEAAGKIFGLHLSNAIKLLDVSSVIIGDLSCGEANIFYRTIYETIKINTSDYAIQEVTVQLGMLDEETCGLGGCHFVIEDFFSEPKLTLRIQ